MDLAFHIQVKAFLDNPTIDAHDRQAKRAIEAFAKLYHLVQNFADCGRTVLMHNAMNGANAALFGFACINAVKSYPFAEKVSPLVADLTEQVRATKGVDCAMLAEDPIDFSEAMEIAYREYYTPVSTLSGVSSVVILRGDRAEEAIADLKIANDQ